MSTLPRAKSPRRATIVFRSRVRLGSRNPATLRPTAGHSRFLLMPPLFLGSQHRSNHWRLRCRVQPVLVFLTACCCESRLVLRVLFRYDTRTSTFTRALYDLYDRGNRKALELGPETTGLCFFFVYFDIAFTIKLKPLGRFYPQRHSGQAQPLHYSQVSSPFSPAVLTFPFIARRVPHYLHCPSIITIFLLTHALVLSAR